MIYFLKTSDCISRKSKYKFSFYCECEDINYCIDSSNTCVNSATETDVIGINSNKHCILGSDSTLLAIGKFNEHQ